MSLNWQLPKGVSKDLLTITPVYKGKTQEATMHPILHRLIFLTMRLGCDLTRNQSEVASRLATLAVYQPDLVSLQYDEDADRDLAFLHNGRVVKFLDYHPNAVKTADGWSVRINADWVIRYWGLSTNATRIPFKKWLKRESDIAVKEAAGAR